MIASSTRLSWSIGVVVDDQDAGRARKEIGAAGEGAIDMHALAGDGGGDLGGGHVLGHVARLEPRHHDLGDPGRVQRRDLDGADQRSLLEHQRALADGVHGGGADGVLAARPLRIS